MLRRPFYAYAHNVAELTAVDHIYRRSQLVTCLRSHTYPTLTQARQSGVEHGVDAVYRNALELRRPYRVSVQWCVAHSPRHLPSRRPNPKLTRNRTRGRT